MANEKTAAKGEKIKRTRTVKPKALFMLYKGDIDPSQVRFTKDATQVLELCLAEGFKYAKVELPGKAPKAA